VNFAINKVAEAIAIHLWSFTLLLLRFDTPESTYQNLRQDKKRDLPMHELL
jgi:hypothetical protein